MRNSLRLFGRELRASSLAIFFCVLYRPYLQAQLHIEKPLVDVGEIKGSVPLQHRLELSNQGDQTIEVVDVTASCGCLAPRVDTRALRPGQKTTLVLDLRPFGQANGPHVWNGLVRYRQGSKVRDAVFTVRATIRNEVTVQPTVVALFVEGVVRQEVTVTDLRRPPFKVTQAQATGPALRVETKAAENGTTKITLTADGKDITVGRQAAILDIYTDDPVYSHFQVPVTLIKSARPTVTATPERVTLAFPSSEQEASALIRLRGRNGVTVAKVEASDPALTCTWARSDEGETVLRVRYRVEGLSKIEAGWVRVSLSEPAGEVVTIAVEMRR